MTTANAGVARGGLIERTNVGGGEAAWEPRNTMTTPNKSLEDCFADWEGYFIGTGYGTGEEHTLRALKTFLGNCPKEGSYDYKVLEDACGPSVAWLLINLLIKANIIEYGTSPRYAWLTQSGKALKAFVDARTLEQLAAMTVKTEDYDYCYPNGCNHGEIGWVPKACKNPFW